MDTYDLAPDTLTQIVTRLVINEGTRLHRYQDSLGIWTIADGFNLTRSDASQRLTAVGVANPSAVINGTASITGAQATALMRNDLGEFVTGARNSLSPIFDDLSPARQAAVVDLEYNMGDAEWETWTTTRGLIVQGQKAKTAGDAAAHGFFAAAADHLVASAYEAQVGNRGLRNAAMIRDGGFVDPTGDGTY